MFFKDSLLTFSHCAAEAPKHSVVVYCNCLDRHLDDLPPVQGLVVGSESLRGFKDGIYHDWNS